MPEEDTKHIEDDKSIYRILGQLETKVGILVDIERNRSAELTRILDAYQKSVDARIEKLEKDVNTENKRLETADADIRKSISDVTTKFETALKTTNDTVSSLRDKAVAFTAIIALLTVLSPFLPKMLSSLIIQTHSPQAPSGYIKP